MDFVFVHILHYQLDIVALTETWLSSDECKNKHVIDQCGTQDRSSDTLHPLVHINPLITSFASMESLLTICSISLRVVIYGIPPPKQIG